MIAIILNVVFWAWCAGLAVLGSLLLRESRNSGGDATGGMGVAFMGLAAFALLAISLAGRALAWWLL